MSDETGLSPEARHRIERAQAQVTEEALEEMLGTTVGFEPADLSTLLDLVAIGLTNGTWRNSPVENWHAEGRLSDGDMMRINSHTTAGVRRRLEGWSTELGIDSVGGAALADIDVDDAATLALRLFRWFTNPRRALPTGVTLGELARTKRDLKEYEEHADSQLGSFVHQMEEKSVRFGLYRVACHGALACSTWWAHPNWPALVERFITVLDRPGDSHWGPGGEWHEKLIPEPPAVQDRDSLRTLLLRSPWELDVRAAEWITDAGSAYAGSTAA